MPPILIQTSEREVLARDMGLRLAYKWHDKGQTQTQLEVWSDALDYTASRRQVTSIATFLQQTR